MDFVDCSPPISPTLEHQRDALQKGLGRAWYWASSGKLYEEPLLEACLLDMRYDQQCEMDRADWLWKLVRQMECESRFRDPIFDALMKFPDDRNAQQLCRLARWYAESGDAPFRTRLYEIVEQKVVPDSPWLAEEEIIRLDGEQGFLFAARVRGKRLATIEGGWDDSSLADNAAETFGKERILQLLADCSDPGTKRFYENWRKQSEMESPRTQSHRDRMRTKSVDDIVRAAQASELCYWFRGWGMHADEPDLQLVFDIIWKSEPRVMSRLLRVFSNRSLSKFDRRFIDLCQHDDGDVRDNAYRALAKYEDAAIREFALRQLSVKATGQVILLFAENFKPGDETRLFDAIQLPEDPCELHGLLMDLLTVLQGNVDADGSQLGIVAYRFTPCQNCRFGATRLLLRQNAAPTWLIDEYQFDADQGFRELIDELPAT